MPRVHHVLVRMHVLEGGLPSIPPHIIQHPKIIICKEYWRGRGRVFCMVLVGVVMSVQLEVKLCRLSIPIPGGGGLTFGQIQI